MIADPIGTDIAYSNSQRGTKMKKYLNENWYLIDCALRRLEYVVAKQDRGLHGFKNYDTNLYGISIKYFG